MTNTLERNLSENGKTGHRTPGRNRQQALFMLELAEATDCRPVDNGNGIYRARSPFLQRIGLEKPMTIDINENRFHCEQTQQRGNGAAFAAHIWSMTAADAANLISAGAEPLPTRPPYQPRTETNRNSQPYEMQNTAVLTRAMAYYREQLQISHESHWYLACLGVNPQRAAEAHIGWAPPNSHRELGRHLRNEDVTEQEINQSPLFNQYKRETLSNHLIIADMDHAGGVLWMMGVQITPPGDTHYWPRQRPNPKPLRGHRPYMTGIYRTPLRASRLYITDDIRAYIRLICFGRNTIYTQQRGDPDRIAEHVTRRNPRSVTVLMRQEELGQDLGESLVAHDIRPRNISIGTNELIDEIINSRIINIAQIMEEPEANNYRRQPNSENADYRRNGDDEANETAMETGS